MSKSSTQKALDSFISKAARKAQPKKPRKAAASPEKDVVKKILNWCRGNGLSVNEIEAKAVYNERAGHYLRGQVAPGYSDISGNTSYGVAVYIEAKAKGRRCTLKPHQQNFLIDKINTHCFAVCIDDIDKLKFMYHTWYELYKASRYKDAQDFLLNMLPKAKKNRSSQVVDDELGF